MCEVCAASKSAYSRSTAAVQRQPFFKFLPSWQQSRCMCVWLVHSRRSNHDYIFAFNAIIEHTSSDLVPDI